MIERLLRIGIALAGLAEAVSAAQPSSSPPVSAPLRDLPWGQLNFLHTTDTHGWHAGHLSEPSFGADWGDYISFAEHLHERADKDGSDLLLIDTGDRIEGNGLYDASRPKGKYTFDIFSEQHIDLLCSGNHELYKNQSSKNEYEILVPRSQSNYLASNLNIIDPATGEQKPMAQRYKKFVTKNQRIRIVAFGFLFDFTGNSNNTIIQPVEDTVKESWFQSAIRDREVDLFLIIGHVPLRSSEFSYIFRAIRQQNWDTPMQFFGGHTHIRDYAKYDKKAYALESGRYMETIGFQSISGLTVGPKSSVQIRDSQQPPKVPRVRVSASAPTYARRYIDNNLYSFHHHTLLDSDTFPTKLGRNVSLQIALDRKALDLDHTYGCAPHDYWTNRAPFPSANSIFSWLQDEVLSGTIKDTERADQPRLVLTNSGAVRFDIFEGPFTIDSMYAVSPFTSEFRYIRNVPYSVAKRLISILNQEVPQLWQASEFPRHQTPVSPMHFQRNTFDVHSQIETEQLMQKPMFDKKPTEDLVPGYTTIDDAGRDGDDTVHTSIDFFSIPNCLETRISFPLKEGQSADPETVDLVYVDFIERYILLAIRFLGTDYTIDDTAPYMQGKTLTSLIEDWVQQNWHCPKV